MSDRSQHVGLPVLTAEREKLLAEYEIALRQVADDPVRVDHGNIGEAALRNFLARFLPKMCGVTKGHIITPACDYAGSALRWSGVFALSIPPDVIYAQS